MVPVLSIPVLLALNLGTGAMVALIFATIVLRARHFSKHGKEALAVVVLFIAVAAFLRAVAVNFPDFLSDDWNRLINGWVAVGCAVRQISLLVEAEMENHLAKLSRLDLKEMMK